MASDSLSTALGAIADGVGELARETTWYLFGSSNDRVRGSDVDLLIVYGHRDVERANALREAILDAAPPAPLDLLLLTPDEAVQFDFIEKERCRQIWP